MVFAHGWTVEARQIPMHAATCTDTGENLPDVTTKFSYADLSEVEMIFLEESVEFSHYNES
jgi:hypothetical protein